MLKFREFNNSDFDYEGIVNLDNIIWPEFPGTVSERKYYDENRNPKYLFKRLVVEAERKIIAYASVMEPVWSYQPGKYSIDISVHPDFQRKGIGTKLFNKVLKMIADRNPNKLSMYAREDKLGSIAFLKKNKFKQNILEPRSRLQVDKFDFSKFKDIIENVKARGIKLISASELRKVEPDWARKLWELDCEVSKDIPNPDPITPDTFEYWEKELKSPNFFPEGCIVALDGKQFVGESIIAKVQADPERMNRWMTGVARSHRRRKIATAMKVLTIESAKKYGAKIIITDNEENNPMYQINLQVGFEPLPAWLGFEKRLLR